MIDPIASWRENTKKVGKRKLILQSKNERIHPAVLVLGSRVYLNYIFDTLGLDLDSASAKNSP
ncbi:hypothetical protein CMK13_04390 [Candidatus Poribacteria bacterium]|jgi:hypothetical protein|nr:hypothetical protein [Candidatus Poribacteria bacterium]OUT64583.1 MAG: hypothetical protein CBB75_04095 [bacterium TMED15]